MQQRRGADYRAAQDRGLGGALRLQDLPQPAAGRARHVTTEGKLPDKLWWLLDSHAYGLGATTDKAYFDPVVELFGSSNEDKVDPDGVARRLGIEADLDSAEGLMQFGRAVGDLLV